MTTRNWIPMIALSGAFLAAAPAWAQEASTAPSAASVLEEVVVTAERREESLQKTSISITAISGQDLQKAGSFKVDDVIQAVPGVKIVGGPAGYLVRIRGEGINVPPTVGDPSVPVMADGLYNAQVTTTFYGIYDLDHVEVLRGPQGTLFGKNSTGGVVNFITANPKKTEEALVSVGAGTYGLLTTEAMYNTSLSDSVSVRIAASTIYHDGYLSNGDNGQDSKSVRAKVLFTPSERFSALIGAEASTNGGTPPGSVVGWGLGKPTLGSPPFLRGSTDPWYDPQAPGAWWRASYQRYWADIRYDLGWAELSVLPSAQVFDIKWHNMFANTDASSLGGYQISAMHQYAGEVHLSSPTEQKWKWLTGVYYFDTPDWNTEGLGLGTVSAPYNGGLTVINSAAPTYTRNKQTIRDYAAFAQTTIPLTDSFRVTLGGRVTNNKKTMDKVDNATVATAPYLQYWNLQTYRATGAAKPELSTTQFTYKAGLEFDVAANSLLYLQASSGFIGGAFNTFANTTSPPETLKAYELGTKNRFFDESLQLNAEVFDNEIKNAQTFYSLVNPYINGTTVTGPPTLSQILPASARSYGGEVEASWLVSKQDRLDLSASYLHARFGTFADNCVGRAVGCGGGPPSIVRAAYNGSVLPQSPTWTLTAGYEHVFPFANGAKLTAHGEFAYHTKYYLIFNYRDFPPYSSPPPFPANEAEVGADHTSNASLSFASPTEKWNVTANVRNIENTATKTGFFGPSVQVSDPRTYNLIVSMRFH